MAGENLAGLQPDEKRQEQAKRYAAVCRKLYGLDLAVAAAFLLVILFAGIAIDLRAWFATFASAQWLRVVLMFLVLSVGYTFLLLPSSYHSGYRLAHRFGLSTQHLRAWLWDWLKSGVIGLVLGLIVVEVVYFFLSAFPSSWWLWTAVVMLFFTVVLANLAPIVLLPLFYKLTPLADDDLTSRLMALAGRAGTKVRGVFKMDMSSKTTAANAALMGLGNTRRIVLGDTLLAHYDSDEIETVLAHELGHHVHADIPKGIAVHSLLTLGALFAIHIVLLATTTGFGFIGITDVAAMPLIALVVGAFGVLTKPLSSGWSRRVEAQADRYALSTTKKPDAFARAMIKLADQNLSELRPPRWVEVLLYDHPATFRRVRMAEEYFGTSTSSNTT